MQARKRFRAYNKKHKQTQLFFQKNINNLLYLFSQKLYNSYYLFFYFKKMVKHPHMKIEWSASIGTKWQIVIPKNVREKFDLKPWNDLVVLSSDSAMILIKSEDLKDMMKCFENIIKDYTEIQK